MGEQIVVLGAGIIGLYTAYQLVLQEKGHQITVIAEFLPGDQSANYTSPWAGANFSCASGDDSKALRHDRLSFPEFEKLYQKFGETAGIDKLAVREYFTKDEEISQAKVQSMKSYIPGFEAVRDKNRLPGDCTLGLFYTTYNFNTAKLLRFFHKYLTSRGVTFIRKQISHIDEAFLSDTTSVVFNCTGIGARHLGGVKDEKVYSTRGQVVIVKAPHVYENVMLSTKHSDTYIIPRPFSGGHVILGGYKSKDDWRGDTFGYQTESILERNKELLPTLGDCEIIRECAGLRPSRVGGVRIERENRPDGKIVIHNYGASGAGYQSGYGMAMDAISLLDDRAKL